MPVSESATTRPVFTIAVNDTKPIWFYCSQAKHCQGGMVGVINAPAANSSRTLASYKALAAKAPANLSPGQSGSNSTVTSTASTSTTVGFGSGSGYGSSGSSSSTSTTATDVVSGVASGTGSATRTTSTGLAQVTASAGNSILSNTKDTLSLVSIVGLVLAYGSWCL